MSDNLRVEIEDTKRAIARKEQLMKLHPAPSVEASLRSFQKRLTRLETELASLAPAPLRTIDSETSTGLPESNCIPPKAP